MLAIRVDGNAHVGSGHVIRCCAIARAAITMGHNVAFFVSNEESAAMLQVQGFESEVLGGNYALFDENDAEALSCAIDRETATCVLVDSYAASDGFLGNLTSSCGSLGVKVGYIDDEYRFESGFLSEPVRVPVDILINYGFGVSHKAYERVYAGTGVDLLIGPGFAPVREEFAASPYTVSETVSSILVTTGSTNPNKTLERFASCGASAVPDARIHVIVGANATFETKSDFEDRFVFHYNPRDTRSLMLASNIVISAGGTTLYELATLGIPTVAIPITENQYANVRGWKKLKLGYSMQVYDWEDEELVSVVKGMAEDVKMRRYQSSNMRAACDGRGAARVARALLY